MIRNSWKNIITNIQTEPTTNVSTDHYTMIATIRQKLKAIDKNNYDINLKNLDIGPETDSQGIINPKIIEYNEKFSTFSQIKTTKMWESSLTQ